MEPEKHLLAELKIQRDAPGHRRSPAWTLAILLLGLAAAAGAWRWANPGRVSVRTLIVREVGGSGSRTVLNASGYVTPRREATVSSKVTGKVVEVMVEEGMKVEAGQVLARLDDTNLRASFDLAQAQLASAKSALEETKVRLDEAERELRRTVELAAKNIATESELDHARAEARSLKARLNQQQEEVTVAERQAALWRQQLDDTIIRAPFAGMVTTKNAQPGEMISPVSAGGGFTRTGICTIVDMGSLEVEVDVNENSINRVEPAQPAEATLDAYPDWKIPAKVIAIIPTADRQKATVKVRVGFDQLDPRMLPEMSVKVAFRSRAGQAAPARRIAVPKTALKQAGGQDFLWVVQEGKARRRPVTVGERRENEAAIAAGLQDGEKIVVGGPDSLREGARLQEAKP
jgi:RND family efflux transporter MFP subunit